MGAYGDSVGSGVPSGVRGDGKNVAQKSDKSQPGNLRKNCGNLIV